MMPKFISIGQKILMLILALLLATVSILTVITLKESQTEVERYKLKSHASHFSDYTVISDLITNSATLWGENVIDQFSSSHQPLNSISTHLEQQLMYLRLNDQLADIWLYNPDRELVYTSVNKDTETGRNLIGIAPNMALIFAQKRHYVNQIYCENECVHVIQLPVLMPDQRTGYMIFTLPMTQILSNLYQTTGAEIAIVNKPQFAKTAQGAISGNSSQSRHRVTIAQGQYQANQMALVPQTVISKLNMITPIISGIDAAVTVEDVVNEGTRVSINDSSYLLTMIPLNPQQPKAQGHYLMIVSELSDYFNAAERFTMGAIVTALILFVSVGIIFYIFTHSYKVRLSNLVERFPLINQHRYEHFTQKRLPRRNGFKDELDILDEAAEQLANELAVMDNALEQDRQALEKIAMYDGLTGLSNRNMLNDYLKRSIAKYRRGRDSFCVMLLDIDDFKKVNDGQGHNAGDLMLKIVATILVDNVREEDIVCRFGGDEFVIVLNNIASFDSAMVVWQKFTDKFAHPVTVQGSQFHISISAGMTICNNDDTSGEELVRQADTAMYRAKEMRGSVIRAYDHALNDEVQRKIELESEAHEALENGDFYLALQPLIDLKTYFLTGFEALIRWRHPEKGLISPAEFIPILEKSVLMLKLDYWVIERSLQVLKMLDESGYQQQSIAINLSSAQFLDPNLCGFLVKMFKRYDIRPNRIDLELTETTLISDIHCTTKIMRDLRKLGVRISIDDFGTGYSSLSYLKSMPVNTIKIDRSFVSGLMTNQADKQIVLSTISMVHNMGMTVVAEGIEDIKQFNMLRDMQCDKAQGFYVSKPIPEHQLLKVLPTLIHDNVWQATYPDDPQHLHHF